MYVYTKIHNLHIVFWVVSLLCLSDDFLHLSELLLSHCRGTAGRFLLLSRPQRHIDYFILFRWNTIKVVCVCVCVHYPEGNCTPDTTLFNARTYAKDRKNRTGWISSLFSHQRPHSIHVGIKRRSSKWFVKLVSFELCTKVTCCLCGWHCPSARERAVSERVGGDTDRAS